MSEEEKKKKEDFVKSNMLKMVGLSEAIALQAVNSAAVVIRTGLDNAENLSMRAGDIALNTARRTVNAGSIISEDVRGLTENIVRGSIRAALGIGGEIKGAVSAAVQSEKQSEKNPE